MLFKIDRHYLYFINFPLNCVVLHPSHYGRAARLFRTENSSVQLLTLYSFAMQALPLGAMHYARLLTSHRGAICALSLVSELTDSLRLIMCSKSNQGVRNIHREYARRCKKRGYAKGDINKLTIENGKLKVI